VTKHAFTGSLCEQSHYAVIVEAQKDVEIYQLGDLACPSCLRHMVEKHEALVEVFRTKLSTHGNNDTAAPRALCHECAEMVEIIDGKLAAHHGESGEGCPLNGAAVKIFLHPLVADRIAQLETALVFGPPNRERGER